MSKPGDYSSQSLSAGSSGPAKSVPTNIVDTTGKSREKNDMVGLNDKFVRLIDKVKNLEDEKKTLEHKLRILKEHENYKGKVEDIVRQEKNDLEQQIESLLRDQEKLQAELEISDNEKEDTKKSYEDEIKKKDELENKFVLAKKDVDNCHMDAVELAVELEELMKKLSFLRAGYDEEIKELESQIQNGTVVLRDNSKRFLDMDDIVENVKNQYANMAVRSRDETERWHQKKMDAMVTKAEQSEQDVRDIRRDISDTVRHIQRLNGDLEALTRKEDSLKKDIDDARKEGDENQERARADIAQLEDALRRAKQDLAGQIRDYQALMNLKLAMDIEINTYRKLLEGEEERFNGSMRYTDVHQPEKQHLPSKPEKPQALEPTNVRPATIIPADTVKYTPDVYPAPKKRLLIRVEVESGRVVSESSYYTDD